MNDRVSSFVTDPHRVIALAPVLVVLHVLEEAPSLVDWMNSLVAERLTPAMFWSVSSTGAAITLLIAVIAMTSRSSGSALLAVGWLSFVMGANVVFHLAATAIVGRYSPGAITSVLLFLPYFGWFVRRVQVLHRPGTGRLVTAITLGAAPLLIHGYFILFRGSLPYLS